MDAGSMSLSITCKCGAHLEVDERFAGQAIPCPDCQTPLQLPAPAPVRDLRVSGLAIASLAVALAGAFTIVGGLAAVVMGYLARRRIEAQAGAATGLRLARAAVIIGATGTLVTLLALLAPSVTPLDALLREFLWARRLDYSAAGDPPVVPKSIKGDEFQITLPSRRWGVWQSLTTGNSREPTDHLVLLDAVSDAQMAIQSTDLLGELGDWEAIRDKGLEEFHKSELVHLLGRLHGGTLPKPGTVRDVKQLNETSQEMLIDLRLGGIERTFVVRMLRRNDRLFVLVGGARKNRFARQQAQFAKAFDSFQLKQ
jgi:hypothetical protein